MFGNRKSRASARKRAFQPTIDGQLESRLLLSHSGRHPVLTASADPAGPVSIQTANGGRAVIIHDGDGGAFEVTVTSVLQPTNTAQVTAGTVRATRGPNGTVNLIVDGTTVDSNLTINTVIKSARKKKAHQFARGVAGVDQLLHINSITVSSGQIGVIQGYHDAVLEGPVIVGGSTPVGRIAFRAIEGGSIIVGGSLQTLDVLGDANFSKGPGLAVGQDLDWFDTGGNLTLSGGANFIVGRDIGLIAQPGKGTGPAGQGGFILGNMSIAPGSLFVVGRSIDTPIIVQGNLSGSSRIFVGVVVSGFIVRGITTP